MNSVDRGNKCTGFCNNNRINKIYCTVTSAALNFKCYTLQGRWKHKQFIKGKPNDTGIKFYIVSDPKTGFCFNILLHCTEDSFEHDEEMGKRFALTWSLLDGSAVSGSQSFLDKGHVVYFDRYYTSVPLFYELLQRKTYAVGTYHIFICLSDIVRGSRRNHSICMLICTRCHVHFQK